MEMNAWSGIRGLLTAAPLSAPPRPCPVSLCDARQECAEGPGAWVRGKKGRGGQRRDPRGQDPPRPHPRLRDETFALSVRCREAGPGDPPEHPVLFLTSLRFDHLKHVCSQDMSAGGCARGEGTERGP